MSVVEEGDIAPGARGDGYRSPALDRLRDPPRQTAPIRRIAEAGRNPAPELLPDRQLVAALEARLEQFERQQLALVANLCEAHEAFRLLSEKVGDLANRVETLGEDR